MLVRLLGQHPEIHCEGEIFRRPQREEWEAKLAELEQGTTRWCGFKMFYYHASKDGGALWRRLQDDEGLPVVHLQRRNILRTATSRKLATLSDEWVSTKDGSGGEKQRVRFEPRELRADFQTTRSQEKDFAARFAGHPVTTVEYEDFAADPFGTCARITAMLGIQDLPAEAEVRTKKQNPEPLEELIENYDELAAHFADTRWASFFEGDGKGASAAQSRP